MKKNIKSFTIGLLVGGALMATTPVLASSIMRQIEVSFNNVNIEVNNKKMTGDNILYDGTTYVPIREIAEILDKDIYWEQDTMTININDKSNDNFDEVGYQEFTSMFNIQEIASIKLSDKIYFYYEFLYNDNLRNEEFNKWLTTHSNDLSAYIEKSFKELGTYGVLNSIIEFNQTINNNKRNIIRAINDINGFVIEVQ